MTLNEVNIIKNSVLDATEAYVDARLSSSDFVKTQIGVTSGNPTTGTDGKYRHTVVCNATAYTVGVTYTNVLSVGNIAFPSGSVVFLIAPNAQYSNQFILGKLDTSPCHINGGSISIGVAPSGSPFSYYFNVDSAGNVNIYSGSINLTYNSTVRDYNFKVDSDGIKLGVTGNSTTNKSYNFTVSNTGVVTIKSGSINLTYNSTVRDYNFKVDSDGIKLGVTGTSTSNKAYNFVVASNGVVTIKNGSINLTYNNIVQDYNFKVDSDGIKLGVTGTSSTNKAYNFVVASNGLVTIKSGSILLGATTIGGNLGYNVNLNSSGLGLGYLGYSGSTPQYNFTVGNNGAVTMKSGSISLGAYTVGTTTKYKFSVDNDGKLIATYGYVGGFEITSESIGDPLGSSTAIGMKNQYADTPSLYAWTSDHHIEIKPHELNLDNANINVDFGGSWIKITPFNITSSDKDKVMWHGETSDERYKKNIKEISPNDIEIFFNKVTPSVFKFKKKANMDNLFHCGVIAQNLKEALNQTNIKSESLVKKNKNDILVVDYQELHGLELAGIKNLYRIIQTQQQEIDMLKKQLGV